MSRQCTCLLVFVGVVPRRWSLRLQVEVMGPRCVQERQAWTIMSMCRVRPSVESCERVEVDCFKLVLGVCYDGGLVRRRST